jgi:hypothetical protein
VAVLEIVHVRQIHPPHFSMLLEADVSSFSSFLIDRLRIISPRRNGKISQAVDKHLGAGRGQADEHCRAVPPDDSVLPD